MNARCRRPLAYLALGFVLAWIGQLWLTAEDRTPAAQAQAAESGGLLPDELHTVRLFETASPSIVNVDVVQRRFDPWSRRRVEVPAGSGSGFLWDDQGHVVTNFHVIQRANAATVTLDNQTQLDAELVGVSPDHDLAVLKIDANRLPPAPEIQNGNPNEADAGQPATLTGLPQGRSTSLRVGQRVYAIGNPFGLDHTLTTGVVSSLDREIQTVTGRTLDHAIQTDAAINPGNSGGPLLDSAGRVIGVNTMIFSPSGASAGVGFAIPIDTVRRVVPQLIENGQYAPPTVALGVKLDERLSASVLRRLDITGVLIFRVETDSPADRAGLRSTFRDQQGRIILGDILTAVDGRPVDDTDDLLNALERTADQTTFTLTVRRDSKETDVEVTLD
ncbi:MAG: trypsin-like peptidase domain-containing protein [Planctomycetota bacterium]